MSAFIQFVITTTARDEALRIARTLFEQRLAASGQVSGPFTSIYAEYQAWLAASLQ